MDLNALAPPLAHSINTSSHEKCFRLTRGLRVRLPDGPKTLAMSSSSLLFFGSLGTKVLCGYAIEEGWTLCVWNAKQVTRYIPPKPHLASGAAP
jgi:hypothetical protein